MPSDMLGDLERAKIVITNYHAFRLRERLELSRGGRALLQGRGEALHTLETEGQMLQRVMPELMGMKNILVINAEAHHCYREKPEKKDDGDLKGDDRKVAVQNNEAVRVCISGLEVVIRKLSVTRVITGTDNRPLMNERGGKYGIAQPAARAVGRWPAL